MADFCTFHDGLPLGALERACIASFQRHGHRLTLYSYQPFDLPEKVRWADAGEVIAASEHDAFLAQAPGRFSQFSNGFRYAMLWRRGGWWVDTDVLCIGSQMPTEDMVLGWASDPADPAKRARIGTSILKLPAGQELARRAYERWKTDWANAQWGMTGPRLLTGLAHDLGLLGRVQPFGALYRLRWDEVVLLFDPCRTGEAHALLAGAGLLHLANSGLERLGLARNALPPLGSALRELIDAPLTAAEPATGGAAQPAIP